MRLARILFLCCFVLALHCGPAFAVETVNLYGFLLYFGGAGDHPLHGRSGVMPRGNMDPALGAFYDEMWGTREFLPAEKREIGLAVEYFAERLKDNVPASPPSIWVGYASDPAGTAFSTAPSYFLINPPSSPNPMLLDKYLNNAKGYPPGIPDNIIIFQAPYSSDPTRLLLNSQSIMGVMLHEMGHALGIWAMYDVDGSDNTKGRFEAEIFTRWNAHLYDIFGKRALPGMDIAMDVQSGLASENKPGIFQLFADNGNIGAYQYPTFHGPNVDALTGGRGMPVMGGFSNAGPGLDGVNSLGHSGIMNSIMSYGIIQNMPLTEMELAAFKDMGYNIDLKEFFGKSYYYDVGGNAQVNAAPFGTANDPNTSIFGLGTHILRDNLTLTQAGSIYANGYGAGGVRIDGVGNTVTIPAGVTISAGGVNGTGLLVSYGSNNAIILGGTVRATGPGGIGAHFGIAAAAGFIVRSHMVDPESIPWYDDYSIQQKYEFQKAYKDLQGPLVSRFDIYGSLAGSQAAIQIEHDSHVAAINVYAGAQIIGDITSSWARNTRREDGELSPTTITFGQAGSGGTIRLSGDIRWSTDGWYSTIPPGSPHENSLDIVQAGGHLSFNGISNANASASANVFSWEIRPGASLGGNSIITMQGATPFFNAGTIFPGNNGIGRIAIDGDYTQSATGNLFMKFTPTATDQFIVTGTATIAPGASLSLQAVPAFYPTNFKRGFTNEQLFGNSLNLTITSFGILNRLSVDSPTLTTWWDDAALEWHSTRMPDAYSKYASSSTGSSVGRALIGVAAQATGDMQNLLAALDFSRPDGLGVRSALRQLAPTAYDNAAKASLQTDRALSGFLFDQIAAAGQPAVTSIGMSSGSEALTDSAFILLFAGYFGQNAQGDNQGFDASFAGIVGGMNRHFDKGLAGLHTAIIQRETSNRSDASARSQADGIRLGVHGSLYPHEGFVISGFADAGLENTRMTRDVKIDDYQRESRSEYTALTAQGAVRAGYEWQAVDVRFGPLAGLDYGFYHRPPMSETGGQAARLYLDAANFHSLRSAVGGQVRTQTRVAGDLTLQAGLSAQWVHELLDTSYGSKASFKGYAGNTFSVTNCTDDRDALTLNASVTLVSNRNLSLNAHMGAELFRKRSNAVQGGLSVGWNF